MSTTEIKSVVVDSGVSVFYRIAGPENAPVVLLLHGFPTSSHQYRNLIPILAQHYRVVAPDFPGFGFTQVPAERSYQYTFDALSKTTIAFLDALSITSFAVYIFDYGAPVALRLALERPSAIKAIVSQNGNAYEEGLGEGWAPIRAYWASGSQVDRKTVQDGILTLETTKWQYTHGSRFPDAIPPETYTLDWALMQRPGNFDIQLDLFFDYQNNVKLYPQFQEYFRQSRVPLLAVWGKHDPFFIPAGAEAYKRDLPHAEIMLLDAGHFAGETETTEIGELILKFLSEVL
ncbi:Alpha/beta hydrolase fold protein [Mycena indigotica]|uniref:Alpha/beta hydrolase fold protein n=1 Tax=Mycena indigotica TaxID=2126181 RepID=A0A8H6T1Z1_9AGAR|nr:Alpha/beta hydrolase fold protein [Mycena indigotica]KAF7309375.1 Alpha/beta hydrolase fold protein [Mycena indigotica]